MSIWTRSTGLTCGVALIAMTLGMGTAQAQATKATPKTQTAAPVAGKLTQAELGNKLKAMGLEVKLEETRYDFAFPAVLDEEQWELSMSAVLSQNGKSIWVMAWLDELPRSPADVPRISLLRLLSDNDRLGNGKFFAYIASNRRFVLQRVIPNDKVSSKDLRLCLQDLGSSVVQTYSHWNTAEWKKSGKSTNVAAGKGGAASKTTNNTNPAARNRKVLRNAANQTKTGGTVRQ